MPPPKDQPSGVETLIFELLRIVSGSLLPIFLPLKRPFLWLWSKPRPGNPATAGVRVLAHLFILKFAKLRLRDKKWLSQCPKDPDSPLRLFPSETGTQAPNWRISQQQVYRLLLSFTLHSISYLDISRHLWILLALPGPPKSLSLSLPRLLEGTTNKNNDENNSNHNQPWG